MRRGRAAEAEAEAEGPRQTPPQQYGGGVIKQISPFLVF